MRAIERSTKGLVRRNTALVLLIAALPLAAACGGATLGSVGAVMSQDRQSGRVVVREVPEGMAGDTAGLRVGDEILSVDGRDVRDLAPGEVAELMRGEVGSTVSLTVARGDEVVRVRVKRGPFRKKR